MHLIRIGKQIINLERVFSIEINHAKPSVEFGFGEGSSLVLKGEEAMAMKNFLLSHPNITVLQIQA